MYLHTDIHRYRNKYTSRHVVGEADSHLLYITAIPEINTYSMFHASYSIYSMFHFKSLEQILYCQIECNRSPLLSIIRLMYLLVAVLQRYDNFLFLLRIKTPEDVNGAVCVSREGRGRPPALCVHRLRTGQRASGDQEAPQGPLQKAWTVP